jgi:hypothetical protein
MQDKKTQYSEKLKDPRWQKKRLDILQRDGWFCQKCFNKEATLHVHHRRYIPGRDPWDYSNHLLVTLCEECHSVEREDWDHSADSLLEQLQEKFLGDQIFDFASGINGIELLQRPEIVSAAYCYALIDIEMQKYILQKYFEWMESIYAKKEENK